MEKLNFKTNVLIKSIIGKDLINDDNIAILELVKNSFDANSSNAKIVFKNIKSNNDSKVSEFTEKTSRLIIKDIGIGMDDSDIKDRWLNIAYSEKKYEKKNKDRVLAGEKGVGRFSCDRLGEFLNLYSKKKNGKILHLFINWNDFEVEQQKDLEIQKVPVFLYELTEKEFRKKTGFDSFDQGTILEIIKLRSDWDRDKLLDLKKYLEKLINPNQAFKKSGFDIFVEAEEFIKKEKDSRAETASATAALISRYSIEFPIPDSVF